VGRRPESETIESCALITTDPNELLAEIHDRMPVILPKDDYDL
jgi:putative SOS response-associated peptidase YedK